MNTGGEMQGDDVEKKIQLALTERDPYVTVEKGKALSRVQLTEHKDPVYYNRDPDSDTRYADKERKVGVCYVAGSPELAIAESFQHGPDGPGTSVLLQDIKERSLHQLKAVRELKLVDVGRLTAFVGGKPRDVVQAKGQGSEGYLLTQTISHVCMKLKEVDGLLYPSSVYSPTGVFEGCNLVLFDGRGTQLEPDGATPLMEAVLPSGETAVEFLESLQVTVE